MPVKIIQIKIGEPLIEKVEGAEKYDRIWAIIFRDAIPIGCVVIDNKRLPVTKDILLKEIELQLADLSNEINQVVADTNGGPSKTNLLLVDTEYRHLLAELQLQDTREFFLSIVVCTYDRPADLRECLLSLSKLEHRQHRIEIIVIDNNPNSCLTEPVVRAFPFVRYEQEFRKGVAYARNKGLLLAKGDIIAFVDDDVIVPPQWPLRILTPFYDPRIMCVSGLVLPLELETQSQVLYETYGGLGRGYKPRLFDTDFFNTRHAVHTWLLGGTANVALRKEVINQVGMFDETLGPGLPTGVGEDIYMFYRLLKFGFLCYYEPAAYLWHRHRKNYKALKFQLYSYSKGMTSYQLRTLITDGDKRFFRQMFKDLPIWHLKRVYRVLKGREKYPLKLVVTEVLGNLAGYYAFLKSNQMHRKINGPGRNPIAPGDYQKSLSKMNSVES
jgi:glycosyltransferase involved in cell wall biosynthesis